MPGGDWVVPMDGVQGAPQAKLAARLGGSVPPNAPAGRGSNVRNKPRKRSRGLVEVVDRKVNPPPP